LKLSIHAILTLYSRGTIRRSWLETIIPVLRAEGGIISLTNGKIRRNKLLNQFIMQKRALYLLQMIKLWPSPRSNIWM